MTSTKTVTAETFKADVLDSDKPVLVDFWAAWCGPCKMVAPVLEEIAAETDLVVAKVDIDTNSGLLAEYDVRSVPTLVMFQGGKPVKTVAGAKPKAAILAEFADYV